jgi:hypothetical protein
VTVLSMPHAVLQCETVEPTSELSEIMLNKNRVVYRLKAILVPFNENKLLQGSFITLLIVCIKVSLYYSYLNV